MAGEFPIQTKSSTKRKQWKIYRGHRGPFRRLITELAEDESPEYQLMYAKQLFEDSCCEEDEQAEENARLGVYWLLRASEQGHEEATQMLHHCLITGRGITQQNIEDVKTCLDMPLDEKVSRHAAREIFASLSQGEEYITTEQLSNEMIRVQDRIESVSSTSKARNITDSSQGVTASQNVGVAGPSSPSTSTCNKTPEASLDTSPNNDDWKRRLTAPSCSKSEKLTEEMLVSAASEHCRGYLPLVHRTLTLERSSSSHHSTCTSRFRRIVLYPVRHLVSSYTRLIDTIGLRVISPLLLDVYLPLLLVILYSIFGLDGFLELLPSILYYGSLGSMIITSCQILNKKWESSHFRQWSNLLVAYGGDGVNPGDAQWAHCLNNIRPCFMFLLSLLVNLSCIPFIPQSSIPHSELATLSAFWSFVLLYNFMWNKKKLDFLMIISFGTHVFARYPYDSDPVVYQGWRFIDVHVPTFSSYIMSNSIEFCLHFRLILYVLLILFMVKMSSRDGWRGFFTTFVPHVVCLSWWQMAVISSNGATWFGLIRACLGLFGVVLFLPLAGLSTILIPIAAIVKSLISLYYLPLPATVAISLATFTSAAYLGYKYRTYLPAHNVTWIQAIVMLLSLGVLLTYTNDPNNQNNGADSATLSYQQYLSMCPRHDKMNDLKALGDTECMLTNGLLVSWEGSVLSTRVSSVYNPITSIITRMPQSLQDTMSCVYGDKVRPECTTDDATCTQMPSALKNKCHLTKWNRYEFEIGVSLSGVSSSSSAGIWGAAKSEQSDTAVLIASNSFRNLTLSLTKNDKLWFTGRLMLPSSGDIRKPIVQLYSAGCVACSKELAPTTLHTSQSDISILISASFNSMLHFFLTPLYSFS